MKWDAHVEINTKAKWKNTQLTTETVNTCNKIPETSKELSYAMFKSKINFMIRNNIWWNIHSRTR